MSLVDQPSYHGRGSCHQGPLLGGTKTRKFGIHMEYAQLTKSDPIDSGRFDITHDEADRFVFKVPPLRNVSKTGPYFHDGSVAVLGEAVQIMARTQLNETLQQDVVDDIVAFLDALTSDVPAAFSAP